MELLSLISNLRLQDILDILFLSVLVYHLYIWFWGTKAFKAIVGLVMLGLVFTVARAWGLFLTTWVFKILWQVLVVLLIILFQSEIRQVLERVNPFKAVGIRNSGGAQGWIHKLVRAVMLMAQRKIGALLVLERNDLVEELVTGGTNLEGEPSPELLLSIFQKNSPLHDGAVLIREGKLVRAACYLPLTSKEDLPSKLGTRHRAALGLSERCDAVVVVISEERGEVSVAQEGELKGIKTRDELRDLLKEAVSPPRPFGETWKQRAVEVFRKRLAVKAGVVAFVSIIWLLLAGQQNFDVTLNLPLELKNKPINLEILSPIDPTVKVTLRGLRKDASVLGPHNVRAELDVSLAKLGRRTFRIERRHIILPNDRVSVVRIQPSKIKFSFRELPSKKR